MLGALALAVGVVLGVGSWRSYADGSAVREGAGAGDEDQGRALVKPKEVLKPVAAPSAP